MLSFVTLVLLTLSQSAPGSTTPADDRYFDDFPGTWCAIENGSPNPNGTCFDISRSVHDRAYEERWTQMADGKRLRSRALRAWDPVERTWMLVWISAEGHFQIWRGQKVGADWFIVREFEQDGRRFLSRQAWIPSGPDRIVRVMERSFDAGRTWQLRYRAELARIR